MKVKLDNQKLPSNLDIEYRRGDYLKYSASGVACMEIQGPYREHQEDAIVVAIADNYSQLPRAYQEQALRGVVADLNRENAHPNMGSTFCAGIAWIDADSRLHATSVNLGDSEAYIIIMEEDKVAYVRRLNTKLHTVGNPREFHRLRDTGHTVANYRVRGRLALSRAIGDMRCLPHASNHEPDIDHLDENDDELGIKLGDNQKALLLVSCDGLFESITFDDVRNDVERKSDDERKEDFIKEAVEAAMGDPRLAVQELVAKAFNGGVGGSEDNISVVMVPIVAQEARLALVCDGHGGKTVSNNIANTVLSKFREWVSRCFVSAKDQFLLDLEKDCRKLSSRAILEKYTAIKRRSGEHAFIHVQRNPILDELRVWFNPGRYADKHGHFETETFKKAREMLRLAYRARVKKQQLTPGDDLQLAKELLGLGEHKRLRQCF